MESPAGSSGGSAEGASEGRQPLTGPHLPPAAQAAQIKSSKKAPRPQADKNLIPKDKPSPPPPAAQAAPKKAGNESAAKSRTHRAARIKPSNAKSPRAKAPGALAACNNKQQLKTIREREKKVPPIEVDEQELRSHVSEVVRQSIEGTLKEYKQQKALAL